MPIKIQLTFQAYPRYNATKYKYIDRSLPFKGRAREG